MGRPLNSTVRVEDLNATLRHLLGEAARVPRQAWDRIVLKRYGIGMEMVQNLTRTGEALGYWVREKGQAGGAQGGRLPGAIQFLPQTANPPTSPPAEEEPEELSAEPTTSPSLTLAA